MKQSLLQNLRPPPRMNKHVKLAQKLVLHIAEQGLGPGDRLGTENELIEQHGLSRITVRQALNLLARDGFIVRRQRHGTFVVRAINPSQDLRRFRGTAIVLIPAEREMNPERDLATFTSFQSIVRELGDYGYSVEVLCLGGNLADDRAKLQRAMEDGDIEGVCSYAVDTTRFADLLSECLIITADAYRPTTTPWIGLDVQYIIHSLVQHLLDLGHQDIAVMCGSWVDTGSLGEFVSGYEKAFKERGLSCRRDRVITAYEGEDLAELALSVLTLAPRPTAIIAETARVCRPILDAADRLGLKIPDDLSVAAVGQNILSIKKPVPITAYVPDNTSIGKEVAQAFAAHFNRQSPMPTRICIPGKIVVQGSTSAPPR